MFPEACVGDVAPVSSEESRLSGSGSGNGSASGAGVAGYLGDRDLLSSVCHDLKAPLASMTMGVAFLRRVLPRTDEPTSRVVDALHRASARMSRTIASFSDLAKLQMGELELDIRAVMLGEILQSAFDTCLPEARSEKVALSLDVDPAASSLRLSCDRARVVQALWQLYVCASRVVPASGAVTLRARHDKEGGVARLEVEASRPADLAVRPIGTDLSKPELTIARGLVTLHRGRLDVAVHGDSLMLSFSLPLSSSSPDHAGAGGSAVRGDTD
ncbi:MAG: sensor histidine kinase [Polyangiaceae bacterium]